MRAPRQDASDRPHPSAFSRRSISRSVGSSNANEPVPVSEWLPVLAEALGAKPPRHFPVWLARLFAGDAGVMLGTESRGASNAKAKRELGWTLRHPTWRQGFFEAYAAPAASAPGAHSPASVSVDRPQSVWR